MNNLSVSDIHSDMIHTAALAIEEKVARLHVLRRDGSALACLLRRAAADCDAARVAQDVTREAGAIRAGVRIRAAPDIASADKREGVIHDLLTLTRLLCSFRLCCRSSCRFLGCLCLFRSALGLCLLLCLFDPSRGVLRDLRACHGSYCAACGNHGSKGCQCQIFFKMVHRLSLR